MPKYVILQSGFLSNETPELVQSAPDATRSFLKTIELGKPDRRTHNPYHFHASVAATFKTFEKDFKQLLDFDFREKILLAAKAAFDTSSFLAWSELQRQSPFLTTMHRRFIYDTIGFTKTGKREIQIETWKSLLTVRQATDTDQRTPYDPGQFFIREGMACPIDGSYPKLTAILNDWVNQHDGFKDLLQTLDVIFGEYPDLRQV